MIDVDHALECNDDPCTCDYNHVQRLEGLVEEAIGAYMEDMGAAYSKLTRVYAALEALMKERLEH